MTESGGCLKLPSYQDALNIAKLENEIRYSDEYVNKCDAVKDIPNGWLDVTDEMQKKLVTDYFTQHGLSLCAVPIGLNMLRRLQVTHPNEPIVQDLLYVKNNKANIGKYNEGDSIKDITLWNEIGTENVQLFNLISSDKPTIVFGASHT
jgi:hypothetical protein